MPDSEACWNRAAQQDARWYIATASSPFFERGRRDTDELVAFCRLQPSNDKTLLEIGAGAGRMTHRFAELYGRVIALDVSEEMLRLGRGNLAGVGNVEEAGRVSRPGGQCAAGTPPGLAALGGRLAGHLVHAAEGRRVWARAWRGTRIPERQLLQAASRSGARVELRPRGHQHLGHRHLWVLLWR